MRAGTSADLSWDRAAAEYENVLAGRSWTSRFAASVGSSSFRSSCAPAERTWTRRRAPCHAR